MATAGRLLDAKTIIAFGALAWFSCVTEGAVGNRIGLGHRRALAEKNSTSSNAGGGNVFDVTKFGGKGDGKTDNTQAFMQAWQESCRTSTKPAKLLVPAGTFIVGPVVFQGPCKASPITVEVKGTIKATSDLSEYTEDSWLLFEIINGLVLTGGGTFDGQGASAWKYNDCKQNKDCVRLPSSIKLSKVANSVLDGIRSINSKYFHLHITDSSNYAARNLTITAPANSPNTDGMHISDTNGVTVTNCTIGTGDDCISIGQGVTNASISKITCGPGHGISVGSLGKYSHEKDVRGIAVTDCTLSKTTNGVRIKTWAGSPPSKASGITFDKITMDYVKNPIIIDQKYGSRHSTQGSRVAISDVHFKNIKGTTVSAVAVSLLCSSSVPCQGIELVNIDLVYAGGKSTSSCSSAKVTSSGTMNPPACH